MNSESIRDLCIKANAMRPSNDTGDIVCSKYDTFVVERFLKDYGHLIDYTDHQANLITDDMLHVDEDIRETVSTILNTNYTCITSDDPMHVVAPTIATYASKWQKVLVIVPDHDSIDILKEYLPNCILCTLAIPGSEVERLETLSELESALSEQSLDEERMGILNESVRRVIDAIIYDEVDIMRKDVSTSDVIVCTPIDCMTYLSPIERGDRIVPDVERIFILDSDRVPVIDMLPIFSFGVPITIVRSSDADMIVHPDGEYDFMYSLSASYAESFLFDSEPSIRSTYREGNGPQFWKFIELMI